jgi:hypothetical protein
MDDFLGHEGRDCGEHRPGNGRAWCFDCSEWCYPEEPCTRCELPMLRAELVNVRVEAGQLTAALDRVRAVRDGCKILSDRPIENWHVYVAIVRQLDAAIADKGPADG